MPPSICQQFKTHYLHLVQATRELQAERTRVKQTGDLSTAKEKLETLKQAREHMFEYYEQTLRNLFGAYYLGPKEIEKAFGPLTQEQKQERFRIPFSRETLEDCRDTHILVFDTGISANDIRSRGDTLIRGNDKWLNQQDFMNDTDRPRWRLIRKTPVEGSLRQNFTEQQKLLKPQIEEIPLAREVVFAAIALFRSSQEKYKILRNLWVRTATVDSYGNHVHVGSFDGGGLGVGCWSDGVRLVYVGVSSSRKFDPRPLSPRSS